MSKRILKNTILLYIRMTIVMIVNLFIVRYTLVGLGAEDYGIYNAVAGVVTLFSSLSYVLSTATQRYYSYYYGKCDLDKVKEVFSVSVTIYLLLSVIILILGETIGLWFVNNKLIIPQSRMIAANWIYQFSILSFIFSIFNIPFSATIIAHENMNVYALLSIVDCIAKLIFVYIMKDISYDKLIYYGLILLAISLFDFLMYSLYASIKYKECRYLLISDKRVYKDFLSFSGWSLFGSLAGLGMIQVNTILTNIFFGPLVNAARAIALQINSLIHTFANNIVLAVRVPMIKSYSVGNVDKLIDLFIFSNKFTLYFLLFLIVPLFYEMDSILDIWLMTKDAQTIAFCRLILIYALIIALSAPITTMIQAAGEVKFYHKYVEIPTLLCMPTTYVAFKIGFNAESTFVIMIISIIISHFIRLYCLKRVFPAFCIKTYILDFCVKGLFIISLNSLLLWPIHNIISNSLLRISIVVLLNMFIITILAYSLALNYYEKLIIKSAIKKIIKRK